MAKVKVLESIRQGLVGGGETHVYDLSTSLDSIYFDPIVLSFTEGPMVDKLRAKGIDTIVIPSKIPFDPRVNKKVKDLLISKNIDIVHAHGSRAASNVISAAKSLGIPVIYTVHGWSFNDQQKFIVNFLRKKAEAYLTKKVEKVICVSESNRETGVKAIRGFNCEVINNGISIQNFSRAIDRASSRDKLGFKKGEIWVGFIARLTFQKDPINLLKAIKEAFEVNQNLRLLMVGEGDLEEDVSNYIQYNGLSKIVKRMPFQSNVPEILSAIDIYSLVSHWEGLPIGLLEAMAASKAIIASDVDGTKEIIRSNENGLLIKNGDHKILANSIVELAGDNEKMTLYGQAAFNTVGANFSLRGMIDKTEKVYKNLLL